MDPLSSFFVQRPLNILLVALAWVALWALFRWTGLGAGRNAGAFLVPAAAWALYAAWELVVLLRTPEANIRVDLLLLWPILLLLSLWFAIKVFRGPGSSSL